MTLSHMSALCNNTTTPVSGKRESRKGMGLGEGEGGFLPRSLAAPSPNKERTRERCEGATNLAFLFQGWVWQNSGVQEPRLSPGKESKLDTEKIIHIVLGCICLALGVIGVYLPILPTTPFLLATLFFFANSSEKLHAWFLGTKLYQKHLESFVKKEGMRMQTKVGIITMVILLMGIGFFMMARKAIWVPCIILAVVWLAHIVYFGFFVKTLPARETAAVEPTPDDQLEVDQPADVSPADDQPEDGPPTA